MTKIFLQIHPNRNKEKYGSFKEALTQGLSSSPKHETVSSQMEAECIICADCSEVETRRLRQNLQPGQELLYAVPKADWRQFRRKQREFSRYGVKVIIEQDLFQRLGLESRIVIDKERGR